MVLPLPKQSSEIISTYFVYLDEKQRSEFRLKWHEVARLATKWHEFKAGEPIKIFANAKALEKEIDDLENLSLAAYRAMKYLRQQLEANRQDEDDEYYSG